MSSVRIRTMLGLEAECPAPEKAQLRRMLRRHASSLRLSIGDLRKERRPAPRAGGGSSPVSLSSDIVPHFVLKLRGLPAWGMTVISPDASDVLRSLPWKICGFRGRRPSPNYDAAGQE
jgi:hypothetical protein